MRSVYICATYVCRCQQYETHLCFHENIRYICPILPNLEFIDRFCTSPQYQIVLKSVYLDPR